MPRRPICPEVRNSTGRVNKEQIAQSRAELAFIAAEKRDGVFRPTKFLEKKPISFPFLLDEDRIVTKAYGLISPVRYGRSEYCPSGDTRD